MWLPSSERSDPEPVARSVLIDVSQQEEICLVRCEGRLVAGTDTEYLRAKRREISGTNCKKVLADFTEVSAIGSEGIGFIVGVYVSTKSSGGSFVVAGLRRSVREILDVTRVSTIVPLAADIACGLAMLRDKSLAPL